MKKLIKVLIALFILLIIGIIVNIILLSQYKFELNGSDYIILNKSDTWKDPLYTINKEKNIITNSNYIPNEIGTYSTTYTLRVGLLKTVLSRKIQVLDDTEISDLSIFLNGSNPYQLINGDAYNEPGYTAYDKNEGDITSKVHTISNNINNKQDGIYEVVYQVTNNNGVTKTIKREVIVSTKNVDQPTTPTTPTQTTPPITPSKDSKFKISSKNFKAQLKTGSYTKTNEIIITINDSNYQYMILPNNKKTTSSTINYTVTENKVYTFKIYDIDNNYVDYKVTITNIDNVAPNGKCTLTLNNDSSTIVVTATDNKKLRGYRYRYGSTTTDILSSNKYTLDTLDSTASVIIYDEAGNTHTATCSVVDKSTTQKRSYAKESYNTMTYMFYKPKMSLREKAPLVIYYYGAAGLTVGLPKNLSNGANLPYYAVIPIDNKNLDDMFNLISYLTKTYKIDTDRIFVSGGSAGTPTALKLAIKSPKTFAGIIIVATTTKTVEVNPNKITKIPMWFFQGYNDSRYITRNYVNKINNAGGNAKLTWYSGGHDAPNDSFLRNDLTDWILKTKKQ